jgi:hypothetical protein
MAGLSENSRYEPTFAPESKLKSSMYRRVAFQLEVEHTITMLQFEP